MGKVKGSKAELIGRFDCSMVQVAVKSHRPFKEPYETHLGLSS
jgi:hypothetical protein